MANSNVTFLQSASIVPYLPAMDVNFVALSLMPDRETFFFFDETDVHNYVQSPNKIYLYGNTQYYDLTTVETRTPVTVGSNTADILLTSTDESTKNTILYVCNVSGVFQNNTTMSSGSQGTSVIASYIHVSGDSWGGNTTQVILANDAVFMANNYWGTNGSNTIFITSGTNAGRYGNVSGYNNVSRTLTISNALTANSDNTSRYTIGSPTGGVYVDDYGYMAGVFNLPSSNTLSFRSGDRIFKIIDSPRNLIDESETIASAAFYGSGLQTVASQIGDPDVPSIIINNIIINNPPLDPHDPLPPPIVPLMTGNPYGGNDGNRDPLAQTFFVPSNQFPNGAFVTSIDLFFSTVDGNNLPVTVEIRPVENGFPSSFRRWPNSVKSLTPNRCKTSLIPNTADPTTATTFKFRTPVYLPTGEHAIVILTQSPKYRVYISELGQTIIGSTKIVSEQPYIGSLFKSQNATTWTPFQTQDLMFTMKRAKFVPTGNVLMKNRFNRKLGDRDAATDLLFTHTAATILSNTDIDYTQSADSGSSFEAVRPNRYWNPGNRFHITSPGSYQLRVNLTTTDNAVSPIVKTVEFNTIAIQKLINNGNVSNVNFSITDGGSGYTPSSNVTLLFGSTAGNTSPIVGYAVANSSGIIDDIIITNGGARFTNDMTVIPETGAATFNFVSEADSRGGPVQTKYISRIVSLKEGFDGGDLRLYLTANKPSGTEIKCYYKIRNNQDPEPFDYKNYQEFAQVTPATKISRDEQEKIEYEYRPDLISDSTSYTTNDGITYTTFHQYAVKIVLLSSNTTKNPVVYDYRCIALPGSA